MEPKTSSGLAMPCDRNTSEDADQPPSKTPVRVARKRTKTGCLTCRKRRIKCDEAQPTCQNCVKSRRACQYTKFTFKDHISAQRPPSLDPSHAMPGMNFMFAHTNAFDSMPGLTSQPSTSQHTVNHLPPPFAPLRPRPGAGGGSSSSSQNDWANFELHPDYNSQPYNHFLSGFGIPNSQSPFVADSSAQDYTGMTSFHSSLFSNQEHPNFTSTSHDTPSMPSAIDTNFFFSAPQSLLSASSSNATSAFSSSSATGEYHRNSHLISPLSALTAHSDPSPLFEAPQARTSDVADGFGRRTSLASTSSVTPQPGITMLNRAFNDGVYAGTLADGSRALQNASARHNSADHLRSVSDALENAAVEIEDDDYFDVLTDEEEAESILASLNVTHQSDLQVMHSLYHHSDLLRQRGIHAFIYPGIMDHYRPERVASPLKNDNTARVFAHFVAATGPMLSAFERVPRINPALVELGAMPTAHLSLWTFTLPMRALHNQGLLHAMLAMSSLHIARLQGASTIPSYSHYSWSVSRVHKAVGKREGRHEVAILAATLLLAFYEVMTADLIKWIPHLCGARQLILEIDYVGMARRITEMKARRSAFSENLPFIEQSTDSFIDAFPEHDQEFIASLTGSRSWPLGGREQTDQKATPPHTRNFSILELSNFEVLQDLYWWYVKQDMVHSIISGDLPLMHYSHWIRCPPRAPNGQRSAVYGSFDHVMLMMGRICDFTARDVARKVRANKAAGSPWPEVAFYGMAPATAAYMPQAFLPDPPTAGPAAEKPADFTAEDTTTLRAQTDLALAEWEDMEAAYGTLERALAVPGFLPLAEDEIGHYPTPFGTVVHYASYNIAILQMFVHMGRLMLARSHPFMPPSLAIAVGAAAAQTAEQAAQIGRIAAGVTPLLSAGDNLSPQLAGTFTDCTLPLFFAGVQYRDDLQRRWTASRLWEIEERSGWASAGLCARGCETAWERAGAMEGAPSYTPMQRPSVSEVRSRGGSVSHGPENSGAPKPGSAGHSQRSSVSVPMPIRGGHL